MKKAKSAPKAAKKNSGKSSLRKKNTGFTKKQKDLFQDVLGFRWLKKAMVGRTQKESLDLLDQWILKKRVLTLFF